MPDAAQDPARPAPLAERLVAGDKRALARAITLIESDDPAGWELVREIYPRTGAARIVGFTGPPGVGKSTLCLLYTSDAADDLTRVDLGGRRIIKKKKNNILNINT